MSSILLVGHLFSGDFVWIFLGQDISHLEETEVEKHIAFPSLGMSSLEPKGLVEIAEKRGKNKEELDSVQESLKATAAAGNGQIRYRSPSAAELLEGQSSSGSLDQLDKMLMKRTRQHESLSDKIHRFRGVILVISVPLLLISFVLFLMPTRSPSLDSFPNRKFSPNNFPLARAAQSYAVIFDAGSSGSRVHVFCFDQHLDLVPIGKDLELFLQLKPGLSAYAKDPKAAANSLKSLLEEAQNVVPEELRHKTPVRVGATAGLRQLQGDAPDQILQAVRDFLKDKSTLKSEADWVTVLDGAQEGAYQWVTINYLLGNLGKKYSNTVGVVDLGGGSVQMAYAISETDAGKAPRISDGEDTYVKEMYLKGTKYYLYVHSYLHYGLLAARAEILKVENSGSPCILVGYQGMFNSSSLIRLEVVLKMIRQRRPKGERERRRKGQRERAREDEKARRRETRSGRRGYRVIEVDWFEVADQDPLADQVSFSSPLLFVFSSVCPDLDTRSYNYGGASYPASASPSGSSMHKCRTVASKALKVNESCTHMKCTFGGVWNGGGGDGQKNLFVASFFFDRAAEAGFVDPNVPVAKVSPMDFENEAKRACETKLEDAKFAYPHVEEDNLPYLCMDLVYQFTLLVDGFGLNPWQEITLVKKVKYQNSLVEAAWPLGSAIDVVSSLK
ncbi:hypothetical protein HYC85_022450 [Camellia sinensis]|uniref:Apyrase n=1 Tax=Camellia sinensis TaxID=4442 RepID=A0A7J7GKG3_CAMSI|nr:hypothetical protein HYC85_022450 [Camellia sinensis]